MRLTPINADDAPAPSGGYAQAMEITGASRLLIISGQIPEEADGTVPSTFGEQARLVWRNVEAQLRAAGLGFGHLVKVTTFLADRADADQNGAIRREVLGTHSPALSVIVTGIYDPRWKLEIEAIAAA